MCRNNSLTIFIFLSLYLTKHGMYYYYNNVMSLDWVLECYRLHWTEILCVTGSCVLSLAVGGRVSVVCCTQAFIFNYGAITVGRNVPSLSVSLESHYHLLCLHESLMWSWAWQGLVNVTSLSLSVSLDKATCVISVTIASSPGGQP